MIFRFIRSVGFFLLIELVFVITGGGIELLFSSNQTSEINQSIPSVFGFIIAGLLIFSITYFFFPSVYIQCIKWLKINKRNLISFFGFYILIVILFSLMGLLSLFGGVIENQVNSEKLAYNGLIFNIFLALIVGITEEFIYRGVIFSFFLINTNFIISTLFVSLFFSIGHLNYSGFLTYLNAFIMGSISSLLVLYNQSLYPSMGLHCGWNFSYFLFDFKYDLNIKTVHFWGNLFELFQIGLLILLFISILIFFRKGDFIKVGMMKQKNKPETFSDLNSHLRIK